MMCLVGVLVLGKRSETGNREINKKCVYALIPCILYKQMMLLYWPIIPGEDLGMI